jgi:ubiquitin carboxyl-terminal hydrolase L3
MTDREQRNPPRKCYIPLESNPEVFTGLIRQLGVTQLEFRDVWSIDEADWRYMIPRSALALILVLPTTDLYNERTALEEATREQYTRSGIDEDVLWFQQTIHNACGLYAILHALLNGKARDYLSESCCSHYFYNIGIVFGRSVAMSRYLC